MAELISFNIDKSSESYALLLQHINQTRESYAAVLIQDRPKGPAQGQTKFPSLPDQYVSINHTAKGEKDDTRLETIINTYRCAINRVAHLGTAKAAGLFTQLTLLDNTGASTNQQLFLVNVYIRPRATHANTSQLLSDIKENCDGQLSRLISAGDLNASSAMWDPSNLTNVTKSLRTKIKYYAIKVQRGNLIERFAIKHNLKCLKQNNKDGKIMPTYINNERTNQAEPTEAWIDVVLAGDKALRVWHAIKILEPDSIFFEPGDNETTRPTIRRGHNIVRTWSPGELAPHAPRSFAGSSQVPSAS